MVNRMTEVAVFRRLSDQGTCSNSLKNGAEELTLAARIFATLTRSSEACSTIDIDVWYQLVMVN